MGICALAIASVGFADTFQNRPTCSVLDDTVAQGIACNDTLLERELVLSSTNTFLPYCGIPQSYIASLQQELEQLSTQYIDHVNGPFTATNTAFLNFTLAAWRMAAFTNELGFRRSADGTTFTNGIAQANDVVGEWCFDELQNGFATLTWTYRMSYDHGDTDGIYAFGGGGSCEENRAMHDAALASTDWMPVVSNGWQNFVYLVFACTDSETLYWAGYRLRGNARISGVPLFPHTYSVYLLPEGYFGFSGQTFCDIDSNT